MWRGYHKFASDEQFDKLANTSSTFPASSLSGRIEHIEGNKYAEVWDNLLDEALCREIIELAAETGYTDALLNTGSDKQEEGSLNTNVRKGKRAIITSPDLAQRIWTSLKPIIPPQTTVPGSRYKSWAACGVNPCLRVLRYDPTDHFELHQDGSYTIGEPPNHQRSFLTLQIYLNNGGGACDTDDDHSQSSATFSGGATRIFKSGPGLQPHNPSTQSTLSSSATAGFEVDLSVVVEDVVPEEGRVLLFQHNIWHSGEKVHRGVKLVLRSEIMYSQGSA